MEIHQLRYFRAVAHYGTFTRAAIVEHVAQPSLSQQVLKLEAELGAPLFDRLPRSARLTVFGKAFLPKAEQILRELDDAKTEMLEMAGEEKGDVVLGVIPTIAAYLLPRLLAGFSGRHSKIRISLVEDITAVLLDRLHQGTIDLAIVALPVSGDELLSTELLEEDFFAVLPKMHPLAKRNTIRLEDLKDEPFLLLKEGHCFRDTMLAACNESGVKPNFMFESGQFATVIAMVSAGMGVSAVPAMAVQPAPPCRFIRITDKNSKRKIGIIRLRHHFETRAQRVLLNHIRKICGRA
jgi:LysR family transcriptional regulator, hydrogen peroxide-inducible genes activator